MNLSHSLSHYIHFFPLPVKRNFIYFFVKIYTGETMVGPYILSLLIYNLTITIFTLFYFLILRVAFQGSQVANRKSTIIYPVLLMSLGTLLVLISPNIYIIILLYFQALIYGFGIVIFSIAILAKIAVRDIELIMKNLKEMKRNRQEDF